MNLRIFGKFLIIPEYFICGTVIFYNNNLKILIICIFFQRFQAGPEGFFLIFVRDDHRYQWFSLNRVLYTVKSQIRCVAYHSFYTVSLKMCLNRPFARFKGIHLTCRIVCGRCLMRTPVIQDLRNVNDFPGVFCTAEK